MLMTKITKIILLLFAILISTSSIADVQSTKLNKLFKTLNKIDNSTDANVIEKEIWALWNQHPKSKQLTDKLELGTELMYEGSYLYALVVFNNIIKSDPNWPEAWNKRATLFFFMKNYPQSLNDIDVVLSIEPRHFGALSGRARIFIQFKEYQKAINNLKKAKKIYPTIRNNNLIIELENIVKGLSV